MKTVLDGGCVLIDLQAVRKPEAVSRWRAMTREERAIALEFGRCLAESDHPLWKCELAVAMFNRARKGMEITDKQGNAIYAIARRYRVAPMLPRRYTASDIPELAAMIAEASADPWNDGERLRRIVQLLELGCDHVDADPRGLLVDDKVFVGPTCWKPAKGGQWRRHNGLAELVALHLAPELKAL
jgi:hypothetical protein